MQCLYYSANLKVRKSVENICERVARTQRLARRNVSLTYFPIGKVFSDLSFNFWQALRQTGLIGTDRRNGRTLPHQDQDQHSEGFERLVPPRREARRTSKASETSSSIPGPDHCRQIRRRAPIPSRLPPPRFFRSSAQGYRYIDPHSRRS